MATHYFGSWYIRAEAASYSLWGFIAALLGATILAGGLDLLGQFAYAISTGSTPEAVLRTIASSVKLPGLATDERQVELIGLAVQFGIMLLVALIYLTAVWRFALVNSIPEISVAWFGVLIGAVMIWVVLPLRGQSYAPTTAPLEVVVQLLRYIFLVAVPIATVAALAARKT